MLYIVASCVVFLVLAFGWFGYWYFTDPHYRWVWNGWRESMREESSRHPVTLANIRPYVIYYLISAPLVFLTILFAPVLEWRKRGMTPILLLWIVGFCANLLLFFNYSTTVNWRYFLTGLPAIVPLGAFWMLQVGETRLRTPRRAFIGCIAVIVLMAVVLFIYMRPISFEFIERRAMSREYKHRLEQVPPDAVMISGSQTIAVHYWAAITDGNGMETTGFDPAGAAADAATDTGGAATGAAIGAATGAAGRVASFSAGAALGAELPNPANGMGL